MPTAFTTGYSADREIARTQARRFRTQFERAAAGFLRGTVDADALRRAAVIVAKWETTLYPSRDRTVTDLAERYIEHPDLFECEAQHGGISRRRMVAVTTSLEAQARAIGDHLEAVERARADAAALRDRLRAALLHAQAACAYFEAADLATGARRRELDDQALEQYTRVVAVTWIWRAGDRNST